MESTNPMMYQLEANESLKDPSWISLQQGPYTWLSEEKKKTINATTMVEQTNDSRWKALYRPAAESNMHSFENLSCIFLARVGIDLLSQEEAVFQPASKLIGRERSWSEVIGFFFDPESQPEEFRELEEKMLHDPTQLLDIYQGMLCNAESVAELCLVCYNLHMHVVTSEIKRLMLFATWAAIRWTQVASNQWIWERGTFRVAREEEQSLIGFLYNHPVPFVFIA